MAEFITSDIHFGHYNIALHAGREPWIVPNESYNPDKEIHFKHNNPKKVLIKDHDDALIERWNAVVGHKDMVRILGDFAWKNHSKYVNALKGKKILYLGNHDKASQDVYRNFTRVYDGFGARHKIQGQDVSLSHYAMRSWASSCHGAWQLYGHSHGRLPEFNNMFSFDVGVDVWGYQPIPWEAIQYKMKLIEDWISENGRYPADGESKADGQYDKSPEMRVIETRQKNYLIAEKTGMMIENEMWLRYA